VQLESSAKDPEKPGIVNLQVHEYLWGSLHMLELYSTPRRVYLAGQRGVIPKGIAGEPDVEDAATPMVAVSACEGRRFGIPAIRPRGATLESQARNAGDIPCLHLIALCIFKAIVNESEFLRERHLAQDLSWRVLPVMTGEFCASTRSIRHSRSADPQMSGVASPWPRGSAFSVPRPLPFRLISLNSTEVATGNRHPAWVDAKDDYGITSIYAPG
jgi:hypothetical protein